MLRQLAKQGSRQSRFLQASRHISKYSNRQTNSKQHAVSAVAVGLAGAGAYYLLNSRQEPPITPTANAQLALEAKSTEELVEILKTPQLVAAFAGEQSEEPPKEPEVLAAEKPTVDEVVEKVEEAVEKTGDAVKAVENAVEKVEAAGEAILEAGEEIVGAVKETIQGEPVEKQLEKGENPFSEPETRSAEYVEQSLESRLKAAEDAKALIQADFEATRMEAAQAVKSAIEGENDAADRIHEHTGLMRAAMNDTGGAEERADKWNVAAEACRVKDHSRETASNAVRDAKTSLLKYREQLNKITSEYPDLAEQILQAEDHYTSMREELDAATLNRTGRLAEANVMNQYKKLIQDARDEFQKELFSAESLPDDLAKIKEGWAAQAEPTDFNKEELNALIAHAHFQINALKDELSAERARVVAAMADAVSAEREQLLDEATAKVTLETEHKFQELQRLHEEKILKIRKQYEDEVILQLRRQTASHVSHISEVVAAAETSTTEKLQQCHQIEKSQLVDDFEEKIQSVKNQAASDINEAVMEHQTQLGMSVAHLEAVQAALAEHGAIEGTIDGARRLAIAARSMVRNVMRGGKSLSQDVEVITKYGNDATAEILERVCAANSEILGRGVLSQKELRKRFYQMIEELRVLQFIPDECNLAERVANTFIAEAKYLSKNLPTSLTPPDAVGEMTSSDVLAYATYCVEQGNIEQAARFMAQLNGRAALRAASWTTEACRYTEFRQASSAIATIAEAISLGLDNFA